MTRKSRSSIALRTGSSIEADAPAVFTRTNTVLVAVAQVGVIVIGCLGAATSHRISETMGGPMRLPTLLLVHYWAGLIALPPVWIGLALWLRARHNLTNDAKGTVFWVGVLMLGALFVLGLCAFFGPMFVPLGPYPEPVE